MPCHYLHSWDKTFSSFLTFYVSSLIYLHFKSSHSVTVTKFPRDNDPQRNPRKAEKKEKQRKTNCMRDCTLTADRQAWVMSVIRSGCWICHVLLASRWLSTGGGEGRGWDSWQPLAEPCGLITCPGKCMRPTNIKSAQLIAMPVQCRGKMHLQLAPLGELHFSGWVRQSSFPQRWLIVMVP